MKKITLPKKFEMKYRKAPYVYNENWISNGCFMIKKDLIKDCFKYCKPCPESIVDLERIIPNNPSIEFIKTNKIIDTKDRYLRVFWCEDQDKEIYFDDNYITHFKIEKLKGREEQGPYISEDETVVIMPCRL